MKPTIPFLIICLVSLVIAPDAKARGRWDLVKRVIDGDTVELQSGEMVRYLGIDAPEIDHLTHASEPYAEAALELNRRLVGGKRIYLLFEERRRDRYDRLLAYPYDDRHRLISRMIIAKGLAYYYPDADRHDGRQDGELLAAQRMAMKRELGIWSVPPSGQGPFIGNRRTRRFHTLDCPYGSGTQVQNRVKFITRRQALWQGYAPGNRCLGSPIKKGLRRR